VRRPAALVELVRIRLALSEEELMTTPEITLPRAVLWPFAAVGTAIGWSVGRILVAIGWAAGRVWLIMAYFAEAVIYGFRMGAMIGPKQLPDRRAPRTLDNSKV
jgi:hypothetical protein